MKSIKYTVLAAFLSATMFVITCHDLGRGEQPGGTPPEVNPGGRFLFLIDQGTSMNTEVGWAAGRSRWGEVRDEIAALLVRQSGTGHWFGLDAFPDGTLEYLEGCHSTCCENPSCFISQYQTCLNLASQCSRGCAVDLQPVVLPAAAAASGPGINSYLNLQVVPTSFGSTPLLRQLQYYNRDLSALLPEFYANDGHSYLVIIVDSGDTCDAADPDDPAMVADLATTAASLSTVYGIRTVVIGLIGPTSAGSAELNAVAANGGTSLTAFLPITAAGELETALNLIIAEATGG